MQAKQLLRWYPPAWRERYGNEFEALLSDRSLSAMEVFDVFCGAIDAWLSPDVRRHTIGSAAAPAGGPMLLRALACDRHTSGVTPRDGLVGAGVMIALTIAFKLAINAAVRFGYAAAADALTQLAFPVAFSASMPWWLMKGQPWKAQLVIVGGTLALLVVIAVGFGH
jgi:hypothetical protein